MLCNNRATSGLCGENLEDSLCLFKRTGFFWNWTGKPSVEDGCFHFLVVFFLLQLGGSILFRFTNGCATRFAESLSLLNFHCENQWKTPGWGCAINAKQLLVKFTAEVDADSAKNVANYTIVDKDGNPVALEAGFEVTPGNDNKSVVLTLDNGITTKTDLVVTVKNVALKGDTTVTVPLFSTTVTVEDTVAPEVASVTSKTNGDVATSLTITYSEPVVDGVIKIDGVNSGFTANSNNGLTQTLNGLNLDANTSHKLEIVNLTDEGGNAQPLVSKTFSIEKDVDAPAVSSVTAYGDNKFVVTFSKKMNAATVNDTNISVKNESLVM